MQAFKESLFYNIISFFLDLGEKIIENFHDKIYKKDNQKIYAYDSIVYKSINTICKLFGNWQDFLYKYGSESYLLGKFGYLRIILQKLGIFLVIIPFNYLFIDYIIRNVPALIRLSTIWDELALLGSMMYIFFNGLWSDRKYKFKLNILDIIVMYFFLVGICLMLLVAPDKSVALEGFRAVYQHILWYIPMRFLLNKDNRIYALRSLVISGFFLGFHACYQFIRKVPMPGNWVDSTETITTRAFSIIGSPNILGAMFVILIPIVISMAYIEKNKIFKWLSIISIPAMFAGLLVTFARQAYLSIFGAFGIFFVVFYPAIIKYLIIFVGIVMVAFPTVADRILYLFTPTYYLKSAKGGRVQRYLYAIQEWSKAPILGNGLGRFGGAVAINNELTPFYVDSYYLKTLGEMGLVGLISMIFTFLYTLSYIRKVLIAQGNKENMVMVAGLFVGVLGIFLQNFVENVFEVPMMIAVFWGAVAISLTYDVDRI